MDVVKVWRTGAACGMTVFAIAIASRAQAQQPPVQMSRAALSADTTAALPLVRELMRSDFSRDQEKFRRVLEARVEKRAELKELFGQRGIAYPAAEIFLRIFKRERELELWVRPEGWTNFALLKMYPVCALAGAVGPKRSEGDGQTPEGFYTIDGFNPTSDFYLSLRLDYPNKSDRILSDSGAPGGGIFIHGGCRTEGCMAVTDDAIKELYLLAMDARAVGQQRIPVHIFPTRLTDDALGELSRLFQKTPGLPQFWANLKPAYDYFETNRRVPQLAVGADGRYRIVRELGSPITDMRMETVTVKPMVQRPAFIFNAPPFLPLPIALPLFISPSVFFR